MPSLVTKTQTCPRVKWELSGGPEQVSGAPWSWKVVEFRKTIFQAWKGKVMENSTGHGKVMENDDNAVEFLLLH